MIQHQKTQFFIALFLFFLAGVLSLRYVTNHRQTEPMIYFYDLSAEELFAAPKPSIPPIRGIDGEQEDGVRAIVISRSGSRADEDLEIAYLEKYSPELKAQFEARRAGSGDGEMPSGISRAESKAHTFVRRVDGQEWFPMNSAQAEEIVSDWNVKGPDGEYPLVVTPK